MGRFALLLCLPLAVLGATLLCGCRADLGSCCANRDAVVAATMPAAGEAPVEAPKASFADRMRSRWAQTSLTPKTLFSRGLENESTMNALRGVDEETLLAAQACMDCMQAKADRLADACRPFSAFYIDAHCH